MSYRNVGAVVSQATTDVIVPMILCRRETGSGLEVDRPQGETYKRVTQDKCGVPRFTFVGHFEI